ncbi:T9SS type B sorting domain-containing protein [Hymenobacter rubidus]|uniref:T9SS type B sorting domain-containing protein n=1 Tax=Hymenobacter rubidus TaxID=1441626 RepID=UPI00191F84E0|nr:gliding motility-associated C-terminal domain-containing protein [Hymenobacter rubidus]
MSTTLLRRFFGPILLLVLLVLGVRPAQATHLLGGEMSYRYLDANGPAASPFRYEVTVNIYSNGLYPTTPGITGPPATAPITVYSRTSGAGGAVLGNYSPARQGVLGNPIAPHVPAGCAVVGPSQPFYLCRYVQIVTVPFAADGYYAVFSLGARNNDIDNINNSGGQNLVLSVSMATPLIYNRSPVFSDTAVAIVCQNDTTLTLNNAYDADGDRLVYSFGTPYGGLNVTASTPPVFNFQPVPYKPNFSATAPFGPGAGNFALLNASTGVAKYGGTTLGKYVVAVDVSEYRNINGREVLIGTTRRDLQLVVASCPTTPPPVIPTLNVPRNYTIEEGQSVSIPISATQANNHPLVLTVNSALLDGSGPYNTTFNGSTGTVLPGNLTGTATATGNGTVSGTFVYNSTCGNARANPYDISVRVQDNGCGGKLAVDIFQVTVTRAAGPTAINGPATVCDPATVRTYTATGATPASYRWRITGGTINSGQGTSSVNVTWASANSTGTLVVKGISSYGCPTDSVTKSVDIRPLPALNVTASAPNICLGGSSVLTVTGQAGLTYTWSGGGQSSTSNTITVSPTATTTYTVTGTDGTCTITGTVTVTVTPPPTANAGADRSVCPGVASTPLGAAPIAGATYSWSPAIGLSSTTAAQPTVTLPNTTGAPITQVYTLTVSVNGSCSSQGTVTITVNPAATADAGPARATCSNVASVALGTPALPGYTYSWSPATGLSSTTAAQPTATIANTTGAPTTTTYTVTATNATGCSATSTVVVTVNPAAVATPGPAVSFCSGLSATLGTAPVAGTSYSWSPATGLSSTTASNPTVTGTNTTGAPISTTYTLTATTANGCVATATVVVTINPAAVADAGPAVSFCSGLSATLGSGTPVAGTTYAWTPITGLSSATSLTPTITLTNTTGAPITTTYTLTATTGSGCVATSTVAVTVNPAAVATPGPAVSFCSGLSATLGTAPVAGTSYSWSPATGLSSTTASNPTVTGTNTTGAPISTTYTLTATTANGCVATATVVVTINPAAVADAGPAKSTCSNVGVVIGSGTPVAGTTYAWSPTTGLSSATVLTPTVTLPNLGTANITQTYTLTATTANGCTASSTVVVTVFPAAVANAGPAVSFCSGGTATLGSGTAVAGTTYAWTPTTGLNDPTVINPTITLTNTTGAPITTTYTLTATTGNSCVATSTVAVTVNQAAVANAGPAKTTCSNVAITIGSGTAVTGTTYAWTPTTGLSSATALTPTLTLPNTTGAPVTTTYTLTATTAQGCTATSTVAVTVNPAAVADAGPAKSTCSNVGVVIGSGTPVAGTTYAWSPTTGLSSATVLTPTVTLPNLGTANITQTYTLTATTANGCTASSTVVVTVFPAAVANVGTSPNLPVCSGAFTDIGSPISVPGTTYAWTPTTGLTNPNSPGTRVSIVNTTSAPIVYTYTLTATTANGCVATNTVTVTVAPAAVADAGPDVAVCDLKRLTLGTPARAGYTYSWSPTTGLSNPTAAQPVLTASNTTGAPITRTYTVTATDGQTVNQCFTTDAVVVTINPRPAPSTIVGPVSVCPTVTGIAYSVANPVGTAFQWLIRGGQITSGNGTPAITVDWGVASTGGYVKVFSLNAQGCSSDTTTLNIIINQQLQTVRPTGPGDIIAAPPLPRSVCQADGPYTYTSGAYANGSSYSWVITGGRQVSTFQNTVTVQWDPVTTPTTGTIVVTETSNPSGGVCRGTSQALQVLINPSPLTTLAIVSPVRVCQTGGPVTFSLPGGFTGSTYVFQLNGTTVAGTGSTRTLTTLPAPGTYSLTVRETTSAGCTGPLYTTPFTVNPTPVAPTISGSAFVCNVATPQQYSIANATAGSTYQWTVTGGIVTAGAGSSQVTVLFNGTAPYTVSAVETTATPASCAGPATTRTITLDNPSVTLTVASVDATSNNRVILTLSAPSSGSTPNPVRILRRVAGVGTFAPVGTVPASATTYTDNNAVDANANTYEYQLDLTNGCGTVVNSTGAQTIRLVATPTNGLGGYDQGKTTLTWNAYVGFPVAEYRIYRRADNGTAAQLVPTPVITTSGNTLTATVPNANAGSASGAGFSQNFRVVAVSTGATALLSNSNEVGVTFTNDTKTYNIITPNHDGKNDVLVIDNIQLYPGNTFTVFNRWGREVYKSTNYQNNWGSDDNIASGTYYYLLTLPNGTSKKGWVEVVK